MTKTILITGGLGFIGSNFLHMLSEKNFKGNVICIDKYTYAANFKNLDGLNLNNFHNHKLDITDEKGVGYIFQQYQPDTIINFCAESHVDRSILSSAEFIKTNVQGVQVLLDKALEYGIKRFVQISTDEVYGDIPIEAPASVEIDILKPSSPYSASKAAADLLVLSYVRTHKLDAVITRSSNNYGPRQFPEKLIPLTIQRLQRNQKIPVYGTGEQIRDWLSVSDNCAGIWAALKYGKTGEIYNLGGNNQTRNIDLVKTIIRIMGKSEKMIEFVLDRKGHDFRYDINCEKARKELKWKPVKEFSTGLAETITWYENQWQAGK